MYQEISNQFLHSEVEFKQTKSRDLLNIICSCCDNTFSLTKHQLQTNWRRSASKVLYCSKDCVAKAKTQETIKVKCTNCDKEVTKTKSDLNRATNYFCSHSCSATFNNKLRDKTEKEKSVVKEKSYTKRDGLFVRTCITCSTEFLHKRNYKKTCSAECLSQAYRQIHIDHPHVINNRSNPESYLELSFKDYILNTLNIKEEDFIQEKRWIMSNFKLYISDFYFPSLNLIVELDGKQHELTKEEDYNRDNQILREFNSNTLRITHKEWITKEKNEELTKLLQPLSN